MNSPEPWTYDSNNGIVYDSNHNGIAAEVYEDDANRIVACVNFCRLIDSRWLEANFIDDDRRIVKTVALINATNPTVHAAIRECLADLYDSHTAQDDREHAVETLESLLFPTKPVTPG